MPSPLSPTSASDTVEASVIRQQMRRLMHWATHTPYKQTLGLLSRR